MPVVRNRPVPGYNVPSFPSQFEIGLSIRPSDVPLPPRGTVLEDAKFEWKDSDPDYIDCAHAHPDDQDDDDDFEGVDVIEDLDDLVFQFIVEYGIPEGKQCICHPKYPGTCVLCHILRVRSDQIELRNRTQNLSITS